LLPEAAHSPGSPPLRARCESPARRRSLTRLHLATSLTHRRLGRRSLSQDSPAPAFQRDCGHADTAIAAVTRAPASRSGRSYGPESERPPVRQLRGPRRNRPAGRQDGRLETPGLLRRRVRASARRATDPRPRFDVARGLSAAIARDAQFASSVHLLLAGRPRAPANGRPLEHVAEGSKQPPM
jgi:hypothetical protein